MAGLLDFLQSASNTAADTVAAPVDLLAWLLKKGGAPIGEPVGGSDWMRRQGLTKPVQQSGASLAGETLGLLSPVVAAAKAPQIARGLLQAGENLAAPRTINPQTGAIVWHGSPHKFDRFDSSKIGTGEGAQAYGHGLYLAESPDVAETYRKSLTNLYGTPTTIEGGGRSVPVPLWAADRVQSEGIDSLISEWTKRAAESAAKAKDSLQPWIDESNAARFVQQLDELKAMKNAGGGSVQPAGALYKVDLPDEKIARMLDWDKPLSQQAPEVQSAMANALVERGITKSVADYIIANKTGSEGLSALSRGHYDARLNVPDGDMAANASMRLNQAGIPGIRYLDGGSRGAGAGTSNFVVFPGNEGLLSILERNGQPLR
jgi:hypothetical protein